MAFFRMPSPSVKAVFAISKHLETTSNDLISIAAFVNRQKTPDLQMEQVFPTLEVFSKSGEFTQNEFLETSRVHGKFQPQGMLFIVARAMRGESWTMRILTSGSELAVIQPHAPRIILLLIVGNLLRPDSESDQ